MTNRLRPIYQLQLIMFRPSLIIFWSIVISIHIGLLILLVALSNSAEDNTMMLGGTGAIYTFSFIAGLLTFKDTFPLALSMGSTRKSYYIGTHLFYFILSLFQALVITLLGVIEGILDSILNGTMQLYHYRLLGADNYFESFVFHFAAILFMTVIAHLLASWAYKIGRIFWFSIGAVMVILLSLAIFFGWFAPIFQWLFSIRSYWAGTGYLLPLALAFILLSWPPVRKVELRKS